MPQTLGAWLRARRLERWWAIAEMARQLHHAAKAASDNTVASTATLATYVRRWERDKTVPTERYRMHYCTALAIPPGQFGPARHPSPGHEDSPEPVSAGVLVHRLPLGEVGGAGAVVVVIPPGCRQVVIEIPGAPAGGGPGPGGGRPPPLVPLLGTTKPPSVPHSPPLGGGPGEEAHSGTASLPFIQAVWEDGRDQGCGAGPRCAGRELRRRGVLTAAYQQLSASG